MGVLTVPLVATALAYGCTAAAILSLSSTSAPAGGTVTVTGKYFGTHDPQDINSNRPVQVRFGSVTGPVLANGYPAGTSRSFTVRITIPAGTRAGDTFLAATQQNSRGQPVYGTPARQAFRVTASTAAAPRSGGSADGGAVANQVATQRVATLSMKTARRMARASVLRKKRRAKRIRTRCARRSRTAAACRARFKVGSKTYKRKLVVRSKKGSASSW